MTYQRYVGDYLDPEDIDYILGKIPEEGVSLRSDAKLQAFSIGYGLATTFAAATFSSKI